MNKSHIEEIHGTLKFIAGFQAIQIDWNLFATLLIVLGLLDWVKAIRFACEEWRNEK